MWAQVDGEHVAGAAKRRRERLHRAYLKYARMSVAMALSEYKHHTSRGKRGWTGPGRWERGKQHYTATFRNIPPPRRQGLSTFLWTSKMCLPSGCGPASAAGACPAAHCGAHCRLCACCSHSANSRCTCAADGGTVAGHLALLRRAHART